MGIDTGGTFTDLVLADPASGHWHYHKVPTRTADPAQGILDGIGEIIELAAVQPADVGFLVLGTTLATNAVLEGKWARTALMATSGFGDVLALARQRRPHYFNLDVRKPVPPVAADCCAEVVERLDADGEVVRALDETSVLAAIDQLKSTGAAAVAVCFLHAYQNPQHEARVRELIHAQWPDVHVCLSSDVLPEYREYERFVTTVVNASLVPIMDAYLARFEAGVEDIGVSSAAHVMQSNGGAATTATVRERPINTFFSGPAGGAMGAVALGEETGVRNLITFDMGGTSTDVCLIRDGRPAMKNERDMGGFPVQTRTIDIHTIGAGGGSIAWIDAGGMLKVGPQSAGAYPGPAAYGRGGELPTVTDANVILGRLSPASLLGGRMDMYPERAFDAVESVVAGSIRKSVEDSAIGILEIANAHMTGAVRVISVEQGEDPRDYTLVAFGGAGPLHAADVALMAGMRYVIVPSRPGVFSAQGLLQSDRRADFSLTRMTAANETSLPVLNAGLVELQRRGDAWLHAEKIDDVTTDVRYEWQIDLRYEGQNSVLIVDLPDASLNAGKIRQAIDEYHERHKALYGYDLPKQAVEVVNLRLTIVAVHGRIGVASTTATDAIEGKPQSPATRRVWFVSTGFIETPVIARDQLAPGVVFQGPAIVEQMDTTTVIPPGSSVRVDAGRHLHIDLHPNS
ncbi:5-oxoprolinase [Advenella kashmirensis W13003]|uniref:5-oxoprolinase n=1 Tax=Advenella kashmirensis W13003 TaxID=1424334 RepID=V8QST4_9BURK|nr:5-oxoprolinase [Advenella kashmirensis W13003]